MAGALLNELQARIEEPRRVRPSLDYAARMQALLEASARPLMRLLAHWLAGDDLATLDPYAEVSLIAKDIST